MENDAKEFFCKVYELVQSANSYFEYYRLFVADSDEVEESIPSDLLELLLNRSISVMDLYWQSMKKVVLCTFLFGVRNGYIKCDLSDMLDSELEQYWDLGFNMEEEQLGCIIEALIKKVFISYNVTFDKMVIDLNELDLEQILNSDVKELGESAVSTMITALPFILGEKYDYFEEEDLDALLDMTTRESYWSRQVIFPEVTFVTFWSEELTRICRELSMDESIPLMKAELRNYNVVFNVFSDGKNVGDKYVFSSMYANPGIYGRHDYATGPQHLNPFILLAIPYLYWVYEQKYL